MTLSRLLITAFTIILVMTVSPSWAGSQQGGEAHFPVEELAKFSKKIEYELANKGARVFIIGRIGRPQSELPANVSYTHIAFGVYSQILTNDGKTIHSYALYNLYQSEDKTDQSSLVTDFMVDYLAAIQQKKVGIIIPTAKLQRRLLNFINTPAYYDLHNSSYSVISNPNNSRYQNCTEYVLDIVNAAIYKTDDQQQLKRIATQHFQAQTLEISPLTLFFGELFTDEVKTDDHQGQIKTATFTTIANYLQENGLAAEISEISFP